MEKLPLIYDDAVVFGLLMLILGFIFYTSNSKNKYWSKFYKVMPALLMAYLLPSILSTFGVISDAHSNLYFVASRFLLPAALVLMTMSIDLKAMFNLGPKALIMFFAGTVGIIIGGPIAILLISFFSPETVGGAGPDAVWRGLATIAGSWIGGGPNQAAMLEIYANNIPRMYLSKSLSNADFKKLTDDIYKKSKLTSFEGVDHLISGTPAEFIKKINKDKGYLLGKELTTDFYTNINPRFVRISEQIATVQKVYMKALLELFPNERIFPDANSTLRITYGKVSGYQPKDAVYYNPVSYLDGIMEKYIPNDYEFEVPKKLIELYQTKDFGPYGENGKMPVNFIGTNHTTGGNSGSPAIDAYGNLIGLNFDRVWEGTMSDLYYDPAISRNIMVDIRYVLFIVDKYAGATRLIEEMKLVHPKKK